MHHTVCGSPGYEVVVEPTGLSPLVVRIHCGQVLTDEVLYPCALVTSLHIRDEEMSETVALGSKVGCVPVPEPGFGWLLAVGVVGLYLLVKTLRKEQR